jgi:hypothetical protein
LVLLLQLRIRRRVAVAIHLRLIISTIIIPIRSPSLSLTGRINISCVDLPGSKLVDAAGSCA